VRMRVTVHAEELRPWTRYVFLVLAVSVLLVVSQDCRSVQLDGRAHGGDEA
jgi:hypothetical protein